MYSLDLTEQEMAVIAKAVMNLSIKGKDAMLVASVLSKLQIHALYYLYESYYRPRKRKWALV